MESKIRISRGAKISGVALGLSEKNKIPKIRGESDHPEYFRKLNE